MSGYLLKFLANLEAACNDSLPNPLLVIGTLAPNSRLIALPGLAVIDQRFS